MKQIFEFQYVDFDGNHTLMHVICDSVTETITHDCFSENDFYVALHNICLESFYKYHQKADSCNFAGAEKFNDSLAHPIKNYTFQPFNPEWFEKLDFHSKTRWFGFMCVKLFEISDTGDVKVVRNRYGKHAF